PKDSRIQHRTPETALEMMDDWARLTTDARKRRAAEAIRDGDQETLQGLLQAYLFTYSKRGTRVSRHTLKAYRLAVRSLLAWCVEQGIKVHHLTRDEALRYTRHLEASDFSPATINQRLAGARQLLAALRWVGLADETPFEKVAVEDQDPTAKVDPFSRQELAELLTKAEEEGNDRLTCLIHLGAHAGLRVSEAAELTWEDVDLVAGRVTVTHGKGNKVRRIDLTPQTVAALDRIRPKGKAAGPVFGVQERRLQDTFSRLCRRTGVDRKGLHALRHTCGTELYRLTRDLKLVARHLGHASTRPTEIYAHLANEDYSEGIARLGEVIGAA
ncbi:MAG: tyrosine-type recombinase/integrase, partial [Armatimonadia bacterium]|nr:tyrosine-type recombinase/integrase [Armatimonadia bacterium]